MDLERELSALAAHVAWPPTPPLRPVLAERPARRRRPRLLVLAAAVVLALAVAVAFAVPQSRGALLRFFHLGGVAIERVDVLPPAQERPLGTAIGPVITLAQAKATLGSGVLLLPPLEEPPPLHVFAGPIVSMVFADHGKPVLLSEFAAGDIYLKKLLGSATSLESTRVGAAPAYWIAGAQHDLFFAELPARLAGNVLIWLDNGVTYRLEGRSLSRTSAIGLARSLTPG